MAAPTPELDAAIVACAKAATEAADGGLGNLAAQFSEAANLLAEARAWFAYPTSSHRV